MATPLALSGPSYGYARRITDGVAGNTDYDSGNRNQGIRNRTRAIDETLGALCSFAGVRRNAAVPC